MVQNCNTKIMEKEPEKRSPRKSKEEKLKIVKEASIHGVRETLDKYGVYPATTHGSASLSKWAKKVLHTG